MTPLRDGLHGHPPVRRQPAGGRFRGLRRQDHRQLPAHAVQPRPAHASDAPPHPPVGVARAPALPLRPVHPAAVIGARQRPDGTALRPVGRLPPAVLQGQDRRRPGRRPPAAAVPGAGPAGAVQGVAAGLRADMGAGRHGAHGTARLPTVRHPRRRHGRDLRGQPVHTDAGRQEEPVAADHAGDAGGAGLGGPADPGVPRRGPPGRRPEAGPARDAVALRTDPVARPAARRPRPAPRMVALHHRLPQPAVVGAAHRTGPDRTGIPQRKRHRRVGDGAGRDGRGGVRIGRCAGRRKRFPHALRQRRKRLRRRRDDRPAAGVAPAGAPDRLPAKGMPAASAGTERPGEPLQRPPIKMAETDLHAPPYRRTESNIQV